MTDIMIVGSGHESILTDMSLDHRFKSDLYRDLFKRRSCLDGFTEEEKEILWLKHKVTLDTIISNKVLNSNV